MTGELSPEQTDVDTPHRSANASIGVLSDLHYGKNDSDGDDPFLTPQLLDRLAQQDHTVVLGDLIHDDELDDPAATLADLVDQLPAGTIYVPGNHDLERISGETFAEITGNSLHGTFTITDSITGIYLNSAAPEYPDARGYVPADQQSFLADELAASQQALVFSHHPIHYHDVSDTWFGDHPECAFAQNKFELESHLSDYGETIVATVNGHTHIPRTTRWMGVHHRTVGAANYRSPASVEPNGHHEVINVSDSRLSITSYEHGDRRTSETIVSGSDNRVALGGTFDPIHDGHKHMFERAFEIGDVHVGITNDELAPKTRHEERFILPVAERRASLHTVLSQLSGTREFEIEKLDDPYGSVPTDETITHLIVSPETLARGVEINERRAEHGLAPLTLEVVEPLEAEDGERISATRICKGEIDIHGNLTPSAKGREPLNR